MFVMMNAMRIHVGVGACISGIRGYRESLKYAHERKQGKVLGGKEQVPIIKHADVRRMLLQQKAYCEGGLALCMFGAGLFDSQVRRAKRSGPTRSSGRQYACV